MMVIGKTFYTTIARTKYWFVAHPTNKSASLIFIEDQTMLIVAKTLNLHLYHMNRKHLICFKKEIYTTGLGGTYPKSKSRSIRENY